MRIIATGNQGHAEFVELFNEGLESLDFEGAPLSTKRIVIKNSRNLLIAKPPIGLDFHNG